MSPEILTIIGMSATILIATWTMNRSLRSDLRDEIRDVREEIQNLRAELHDLRTELKEEIHGLREGQHGLNERMADVEFLFPL